MKALHTYRTGTDAQWGGQSWPAQAGPGDVTTWAYVPGTTMVLSKTDASLRAVTYTYWPSGLVQDRIWARGVITTYTYNQAGELKTITSGNTPSVTVSYNADGRPVTVSDAAGTHTLAYDALGQLAGDTLGGTGILAGIGLTVGHDAYGRMNNLQISRAGSFLLGVGHSYTDQPATGRMASVSDGINTATYSYLPNSDWLSTTVISRLGLADALTHTRTPDDLGRLQTIAATRGAATVESHTWRYDTAGRRDRDTLADGSYWAYSYNNRSEVTGGVKHLPPQGEAPVIGHSFGYAFDPIGNRTQTTVNGRMAGYSRNALNQYPERTVPPAVDVLGSAAPEAVVKVTGPQGTQTAVRQGGLHHAAVSVDNRTAAQYPEIGIEARRNTAAGETVTDTKSTTAGRLFVPKQPEDFAYDDDGNTLHDGRWVYTWDAENRMIAAETRDVAVAAGVPKVKVEYAYDWRSRCIQRKVSTNWNAGPNDYNTVQTTRFLYDTGWNVLAEINDGSTVVRRCLWGLDLSGSMGGAGGIGGLLVESISDPNNNNALTDCLPFYDGNGNITGLITAANGTEVARYSYGPFGETLRQSGPLGAANPYRWSTKYQDDLTGLKHYGYRMLGDGRWMSRDPLEEDGGVNLYGFVGNNGLNNLDILGLEIVCNCPIRSKLPNHRKQEINHQNRYTNGVDPSGDLTEGEGLEQLILARMMKSRVVFTIKGRTPAEQQKNLQEHINARVRIVANARAKKYNFGAGDLGKIAIVGNPPNWKENPQAYFDAINNDQTMIACLPASALTFFGGIGTWEKNFSERQDEIWIPGDWGYYQNTAYTDLNWINGYQGENVIHVGIIGGKDLFWGHLGKGLLIRTHDEWMISIRNWKSKNGAISGNPRRTNADLGTADPKAGHRGIRYPTVGLNE